MRKKGTITSFSFLEDLYLSFGIGISIYISFSYFLDLFSLFNFYMAYLPIVIFDILFLIYYFHENKEELKTKYHIDYFRTYFKKFFSNTNKIFSVVVVICTITIIFTIQWIAITDATSLNYTDPYKWYSDTFYLLDNGHINYKHLDYNYPSGYTYFNGGVLLIYPDYLFGYYYFKFVPLYFISLYIIIASSIIRKLFTKNYLILFFSLFLLISRYFLSRTLLYVSSSLASLILIISFFLIINKYPDYVMGIFIAGLYFIHNLSSFYFLFVLLIFYVNRFFANIKNREIILEQIKSFLFLIIITFILLVPYLISIYYIYNDSIFDFIAHFFERFEEADYAYILKDPIDIYQRDLRLIFPLEYFRDIVDTNLLDLFDELFKRSIFLFFILPIIGLFIFLKNKHQKTNKDIEILVFFKIFILIILIFFFLPYIFPGLDLFIKLRKRILQSFSLPIIIMTLYTIEWILHLSRKVTNFLIIKVNFYKKLTKNSKSYSKLFRIESIVAIILITSTSSTFIMHPYPDYYYYYEDELVEVTLYLRTHAEPGSKILREDFDSAVIFRMLYDMDIKKYEVNESSSYEDLVSEVDRRDIDYLIFSKAFFDNSTIDDSLDENSKFKELLENDDYILYRYKT